MTPIFFSIIYFIHAWTYSSLKGKRRIQKIVRVFPFNIGSMFPRRREEYSKISMRSGCVPRIDDTWSNPEIQQSETLFPTSSPGPPPPGQRFIFGTLSLQEEMVAKYRNSLVQGNPAVPLGL
jgi:hypothetical protein